jgi:hypothetical protein
LPKKAATTWSWAISSTWKTLTTNQQISYRPIWTDDHFASGWGTVSFGTNYSCVWPREAAGIVCTRENRQHRTRRINTGSNMNSFRWLMPTRFEKRFFSVISFLYKKM